ncbi:SDR family NAD(P)-dependent oxidoreductase [Streptococcus ovis]|uniref:SDR family NAD(P)-dependent oxidoreductase n=1 Tax=Streptococcus ovis TaxID=82806 RepID=UPI00037B2FA5|nr:SDR family NAD(P)-dependent oxidoreductase [Streptococcus ovis]
MTRNIFITGATSGIGEAIAHAFAQNDDNVILTGRRTERLTSVKETLEKEYGVTVWTYPLDVTRADMVEEVCRKALEEVGQVDVLVNNAGLALGLEPFQEYAVEDMLTMLDTNVRGLLLVTRQLLPHMVERNQGHIINMGSTAGIYAYAGAAVYSATKSAVKVLSDGIRIDTIATDIKVTTVQPGIVETGFSEVRFHGDKARAKTVYQGVEALQAKDIADITLYIANQPKHVQISDITVMATQQATGFTIHREN